MVTNVISIDILNLTGYNNFKSNLLGKFVMGQEEKENFLTGKTSSLCFTCMRKCNTFCGRCDRMAYCSTACQRKDWETHKKDCYQATELDRDMEDTKRKLLRVYDSVLIEAILYMYILKPDIVKNNRFVRLVLINSSGLKFESSTKQLAVNPNATKHNVLVRVALADANWNLIRTSAGNFFSTNFVIPRQEFDMQKENFISQSGSSVRGQIRQLQLKLLTIFSQFDSTQ